MYADFGTVSFSAMSNSQPSSRPTSESLCEREISAQEEEGDSSVETGDHGGGASPAPVAGKEDSLQEEVAESSAAGQDESSKELGRGGAVIRHVDDDDDSGYHTPTSPRCRIPVDLPCPPPPRKILPQRRWQKRRRGEQEIYRVVRRRIQLYGEFEFVLCPVVDDPPAGRVENGAGGGDVAG